MLSVEEIRERMMYEKVSTVSAVVGVTRATIYNLVSGAHEPNYRTLKKLSDYLERN